MRRWPLLVRRRTPVGWARAATPAHRRRGGEPAPESGELGPVGWVRAATPAHSAHKDANPTWKAGSWGRCANPAYGEYTGPADMGVTTAAAPVSPAAADGTPGGSGSRGRSSP